MGAAKGRGTQLTSSREILRALSHDVGRGSAARMTDNREAASSTPDAQLAHGYERDRSDGEHFRVSSEQAYVAPTHPAPAAS